MKHCPHAQCSLARQTVQDDKNWGGFFNIFHLFQGFTIDCLLYCTSVLWSRDHGLETRVHSSSFCPGLGFETWSQRSWSQDSMLGAYACRTITIICSTFKRVFCHQLELMQPMLWSRDHRDSSALEFILSRSRSWSRDLKKGLDNNTAALMIIRCTRNVFNDDNTMIHTHLSFT